MFMIFLILFGVSGAQASVTQWESAYDSYWYNPSYSYSMESAHERGARNAAESANRGQEYYFLSFQIDGARLMWQATGDLRDLNDALELIDITMDLSVDYGNGYRGWPNSNNDGYPLWDSIYWRIVTTILTIMKDSPKLLASDHGQNGWEGTTYQQMYDRILAFSEQNIWNRYAGTSANTTSGNLYRSRTHMTSHWGRIGGDLFYITQNQKYKTVHDNIAFAGFPSGTNYPGDNLQNQFKPNPQDPTAYSWNQTWDINMVDRIQDMSHANAVVSWMIRSYEMGYYWEYSDIQALINTLDNVLLVGNNYQLYYNVDRTGGNWGGYVFPSLHTARGRGHEWMKLGQYDQTLQNKIANNYVYGGPGSDYNLEWYGTQVLGVMAYNQAVLDGTLVYPEKASKTKNSFWLIMMPVLVNSEKAN